MYLGELWWNYKTTPQRIVCSGTPKWHNIYEEISGWRNSASLTQTILHDTNWYFHMNQHMTWYDAIRYHTTAMYSRTSIAWYVLRPRFWRSKSCHQRKPWGDSARPFLSDPLVSTRHGMLTKQIILICVNKLNTSCRHRFSSLKARYPGPGTCGRLFVCTGMFVQCWMSWDATEEQRRGESICWFDRTCCNCQLLLAGTDTLVEQGEKRDEKVASRELTYPAWEKANLQKSLGKRMC